MEEGRIRQISILTKGMDVSFVMTCSAAKPSASTYKSAIPAFPTIGDDVKAFGGYNYNKAYKEPKDLDELSILQYERKEFIPSHRVFWKVRLCRLLSCRGIKRSSTWRSPPMAPRS